MHPPPSPEQWKPVLGYESLYEVSDLGAVRSLRRATTSGTRGGQLVSPSAQGSGHLRVKLSRNGIVKTIHVHRLVLDAFRGPAPVGMEARHWPDQSPSNNVLMNLSWATRIVNSADRITARTDTFTFRNPKQRYAEKDYARVISLRDAGHSFAEVSAKTGMSKTHARRVADGSLAFKRWPDYAPVAES